MVLKSEYYTILLTSIRYMLLKLNGTKNYRMSVHTSISVMRADKETSVGKSAIFKARNKKYLIFLLMHIEINILPIISWQLEQALLSEFERN